MAFVNAQNLFPFLNKVGTEEGVGDEGAGQLASLHVLPQIGSSDFETKKAIIKK